MRRNRFLLLIDDDREICEIVRAALEFEGFSVRTAHDAASGLRAANSETALVLLDVRMPGLEAREFARQYRARYGPGAPVFVFSAWRYAADFAQSIGAAGVLNKPFDLDDLIALAAQHLDVAESA